MGCCITPNTFNTNIIDSSIGRQMCVRVCVRARASACTLPLQPTPESLLWPPRHLWDSRSWLTDRVSLCLGSAGCQPQFKCRPSPQISLSLWLRAAHRPAERQSMRPGCMRIKQVTKSCRLPCTTGLRRPSSTTTTIQLGHLLPNHDMRSRRLMKCS